MESRATSLLPALRGGICPFFQEVEAQAIAELDEHAGGICVSDPGDLVLPETSYRDRYCLTETHRDCARFRAAIAATRRAAGGDPLVGEPSPFLALLSNPIALLVTAALGVVIGLVGPALSPPSAVAHLSAEPPTPPAAAAPAPTLPPAATPAPRAAVIATDDGAPLRVRAAPSGSAEILTTAPNGASVVVLGERTNDERRWYQVRYGEITGWAAAEFIQVR